MKNEAIDFPTDKGALAGRSACEEIMAIDQAVLAAVLETTGEVTVSREAVNRCLREKTVVGAEPTEGGFRLWIANW